MSSLADRFCPNVHDAPITAAAYDPWSTVLATADASGLVAVRRAGESTPGLQFKPGACVTGALAIVRGGTLIAVGDDDGTIGVYRTDTGDAVFSEVREGARGRVRAMRGVAVSPEGARVATIAIDGLLRIWDIANGRREVAWRGFGGVSVDFDAHGQRVLCLDSSGQPRLVDLISHQGLPMDRLQMPADRANFSLDGTLVIAAGPSGLSLLRVVDGQLVASFAARGGSGILGVVQRPDGQQIGAVSLRSVHIFSMPDLTPVESLRHGAPESSGAATWSQEGIKVGGSDGLTHGGTGGGATGPVTAVGGFGEFRLAAHGDKVAIWSQNRRLRQLDCGVSVREVHVDRDGRYALVQPADGGARLYEVRSGQMVFDAGGQAAGAADASVGGTVMAVRLRQGGVRWWDLGRNKAWELAWPSGMALSHGGTWLALITPRGLIKIVEPSSGKEAVADPKPSADVAARLLAFVNRRPDLLAIDVENVLSHYDLAQSARDGRRALARDVLQFGASPDRIWGITGGKHAAVRIPDGERCSILFVDLASSTLTSDVGGLHPLATVDAENGLILEPARSGAILERDMSGAERRVLRSLPAGQWVAYNDRGLLDNSEGAGGALGR
jgi:WD40 repeat protein